MPTGASAWKVSVTGGSLRTLWTGIASPPTQPMPEAEGLWLSLKAAPAGWSPEGGQTPFDQRMGCSHSTVYRRTSPSISQGGGLWGPLMCALGPQRAPPSKPAEVSGSPSEDMSGLGEMADPLP